MSTVTEWYRKVSFDFSDQEVFGALGISDGSVERWEWEPDKIGMIRRQGIGPSGKPLLKGSRHL